ncbi:helix-turn-helix domain-containing protein [Streptomyces sp. NPDC088762]|uniref:helix-turn-helix domain-containing protein n=1 Tax=Streptomyces sp. NPDC088762 TaxID=3365891 RepID=UPI003816A6AF
MTGVRAVAVELTEPVRARLEKLAASATAHIRQVLRARIVLAAADGLANGAIARELEISVNTARKWRGRFAVGGPDGLEDAKRSGRPRTYGCEVRVAVVAAATSAPPHPESTWSHRTIAARVAGTVFAAISASQVGRILADLDLKPHRVRGWLTRRDTPDFWDRAAAASCIAPRPPERWCCRSMRRPRSPPARASTPPAQPVPAPLSARSSSATGTALPRSWPPST